MLLISHVIFNCRFAELCLLYDVCYMEAQYRLTAPCYLRRSEAHITVCADFHSSLCGFYLVAQKHAGRWTGNAKLPLGVYESVNK